ncbi:MAG: hypothetical protein LBD85_04655, partial [Oscillospiraceae bacterium]|nr:hypothetical protein [Oscillospiraceae bacterium]
RYNYHTRFFAACGLNLYTYPFRAFRIALTESQPALRRVTKQVLLSLLPMRVNLILMNNFPREFKFSKRLGQNFLVDKRVLLDTFGHTLKRLTAHTANERRRNHREKIKKNA